jgi:peptidoglycan/LPS O-acetylase OafA/YrhL
MPTVSGDGSVQDRAPAPDGEDAEPRGSSPKARSAWADLDEVVGDPVVLDPADDATDVEVAVLDYGDDAEPTDCPSSATPPVAEEGQKRGPGVVRPAAVPGTGALAYQPALDGLRGLAVAAVLLYHGAVVNRVEWLSPWTKGGFLGVSAFFTLSGFLICSLLLAERSGSGTVSIRGFWLRRARRLLPAALLLLAAVTLLTPLVGSEAQLDRLPGDVWASLLYVVNWRFVVEGADYASQFQGAPSPLRHVWSLSVEEQWYLIVPLGALAVVAVRRHLHDRVRRAHLALFLGGAVLAGTAWMIWVSGGRWDNRAYMGTDTRMAEMALGAFAACTLAPGMRAAGRTGRLVTRVAPLLLCALLVMWALTPIESPWLFRGGFSLHAAVVAVVIVAAVQPRSTARALLGLGAVRALGRISYGVYLIHWPVLWWVTPQRLRLGPTAAFGVQLLVTLALAMLSYRLIERPIRHGAALRGRRGALVGISAVALVAIGAAALPEPDRSQILALGSARDLVVPTTTLPPEPVQPPEGSGAALPTTLPPPPLKVMVVGDSFAESVLIGLQKWTILTGRMAVMDQTIAGCPFGRGGRNKGINVSRKPPSECNERDERILTAVAEFDPDVALIAGGLWDITNRRPPGFGSWTHVGEEDYDWFLTGELSHLVDITASGGARVVWAKSPYWDPVPGSVIYMGRPPYPEADPLRVDRFNQILASVVEPRPEADLIDLPGWLRAQPGGELDRGLRPDGVHFSEESTGQFASWLGPELLTLAGR